MRILYLALVLILTSCNEQSNKETTRVAPTGYKYFIKDKLSNQTYAVDSYIIKNNIVYVEFGSATIYIPEKYAQIEKHKY